MKKTQDPKEEVIYALEEPYPTECYNHGQLAAQKQKYYMCKSLKPSSTSSQAFRVTKETYERVMSDFPDQYSCYTQIVEKNVCICPKGEVDYVCDTDQWQKCAITVTDPDFKTGCEDNPDTFQYLFSVPGFSPCYPLDFTQTQTISFTLECRTMTPDGLVDSKDVKTGYPYRDVVQEPSFSAFTLVTQESESEFSLIGDEEGITVSFQLRDMKYLSKHIDSNSTFTNTILSDPTEVGTVEIDFTKATESDARGESKYVVGGRVYFEAFVSGTEVSSFTYKGFFDEAGYEEPPSTLKKIKSSGIVWIVLGSLAAVGALILVYMCYCKKEDNENRKPKSD